MPDPSTLGRRSLVGTLLIYAALIVAVVVASRIAACREPPRESAAPRS